MVEHYLEKTPYVRRDAAKLYIKTITGLPIQTVVWLLEGNIRFEIKMPIPYDFAAKELLKMGYILKEYNKD